MLTRQAAPQRRALTQGVRAHMKKFIAFVIFLIAIAGAAPSTATVPLFDQVTIGNETGNIFPEKCCWVALPQTERLRQARHTENCSAIGGPVGNFLITDGKIWLTGLSRCSGPVPLKNIYPELPEPAVATWLSGKFTAYTGFECFMYGMYATYRTKTTIVVKDGAVVSMTTEHIDTNKCPIRPN